MLVKYKWKADKMFAKYWLECKWNANDACNEKLCACFSMKDYWKNGVKIELRI